MSTKKDLEIMIFGLTIFLAISSVFLTLGVVCAYIFFRKLRRRIQAEIFEDKETVFSSDPTRKLNKYIKSKRNKNENEPECYGMSSLPDSQNVQGQREIGDAHTRREETAEQTITQRDTNALTRARQTAERLAGTKPGPPTVPTRKGESNQQNRTAHARTRKTAEQLQRDQIAHTQTAKTALHKTPSDHSYLLKVGDVIEDQYYTEPTERVNKVKGKQPAKPKTSPKPAVTQHLPQHQAVLSRPIKDRNDNVTQQGASRYPYSMPRSNNAKNTRAHQIRQQVQHSKQTASIERFHANQTKHQPSRNQRDHTRNKGVTQQGFKRDNRQPIGMHVENLQKEEFYTPMSNTNEGYQEETFYGNQDMIDSCNTTGSPIDAYEEEHYENQVVIEQQKRLSSFHVPSGVQSHAIPKGAHHLTNEYPQNVNNWKDPAVIEEQFYENYDGDQATTENYVEEEEHIYGNEEEEEHIYGNEDVFSSC